MQRAATFVLLAALTACPGPHRAEPRVIPWLAVKPTPPPPSQAPTVETAGVRTCGAADLRAQAQGSNGLTGGQLLNYLVFADASRTRCVLRDRPLLKFVTPRGRVIRLPDYGASAAGSPEKSPVLLTPGVPLPHRDASPEPGQATLVYQYSSCSESTTRFDAVIVELAAGRGSIRVSGEVGRSISLACDSGKSRATFARWDWFQRVTPEPPLTPPLDLLGTIDAPSVAHPGSTLRYLLTLGAGRTAVTFRDCPGYTEYIAGQGIKVIGMFALNCAPARTIAANEMVIFEMKLALPASTPVGRARLYWSMDPPGMSSEIPPSVPIEVRTR